MLDDFNTVPEYVNDAVSRLGGSLEYSEEFPRGCFLLRETEVCDNDLEELICHPGPAGLDLSRTNVGTQGAFVISEMSDLEYLSLYRTRITDRGLSPLRDLINLNWLELGTAPG